MVSVQMETTGQFALEKIGVPKSHILRFDALQDGLLDVRNGKSDAAVADLPALHEILRKGYNELELTGGVFKEEYLAIVLPKNQPDLLDAVTAPWTRTLSMAAMRRRTPSTSMSR